jgi:predicted DNA-binding transcriptional regulator AlpA
VFNGNGSTDQLVVAATLDSLSDRPALAATLPLDVAQHLLTQANARLAATQSARDALMIRLATGNQPPAAKKQSRTLDADEIASALGQTRRWVFKNAKQIPPVRRISRKAVAADETELLRWRDTQKG